MCRLALLCVLASPRALSAFAWTRARGARPAPRRAWPRMAARGGAEARWARAKDEAIRDLLLQRAIQTQMHYHMELHDSFKRQWLEQFRSNDALYHEFYGELHGIRALSASADEDDAGAGDARVAGAGLWRGYLEALLAAPPVECVIELSWGNKFSGGSKANPYINREQAKNYYNAVSYTHLTLPTILLV